MAQASFVPAWKRLGLQLKRSIEDTAATQGSDGRTNTKSELELQHKAKKRKLKPVQTNEKNVNVNANAGGALTKGNVNGSAPDIEAAAAASSTGNADEEQVNTSRRKSKKSKRKLQVVAEEVTPTSPTPKFATPPKSLKPRKSVSFTPDVKTVDGPDLDYSALDISDRPALVVDITDSPGETRTKRKKPKQLVDHNLASSSNSALSSELTSATALAPYLTYLENFHSEPTSWKFNKNLQTQLLGNIFNLYRIPAEYNEAVKAYIAGLQGDAARIRLRDSAKGITAEPLPQPETADTSSTTSQAQPETEDTMHILNPSHSHSAAISASLALDEQKVSHGHKDRARENREQASAATFRAKVERRRRAEMILEALGHVADPVGKAGKREVVGYADDDEIEQPKKKRTRTRRRKKRSDVTGVPDDDSSSSSDSSSSDSESEDTKKKENKLPEVDGGQNRALIVNGHGGLKVNGNIVAKAVTGSTIGSTRKDEDNDGGESSDDGSSAGSDGESDSGSDGSESQSESSSSSGDDSSEDSSDSDESDESE